MAETRQRNNSFTADQIAVFLEGTLVGAGEVQVNGANVIERASADELAFVGCEKNLSRIDQSSARVIVVPRSAASKLSAYSGRAFVLVDEPEVAYLKIARMIIPERQAKEVGISPLASVASSAQVGARTTIHPNAVVGEDVIIGDQCNVGPGVVIGDGCVIGDHVRLDANVVIYPDVTLGSDVQIQAGAVVGADGFGYRVVNGGHERLPHLGTVRICDDVQIGAGTTIDRAKSGETVIGRGTRIDNLVVIAHNCQIGEHNLLVSQTGIAGSCSTGSYVVCAGQAGIADHVHLGDHAIIGAKAGVHRDMPGGKAYLGAPAIEAGEQARMVSSLRRLPEIRKTVKTLEKQMAALQEQIAQLSASAPNDTAASREAA